MSSIKKVVQSMQKQNEKGFKKTIMNLGKIKEEKDLDERLKFKYALIDTSKNNEVIALSSDDKELESRVHYKNRGRSKVVKLKRPVANDKMIGYPLKEEVDIQESGHQDVPSMKTQVQIAWMLYKR